MQKYEAKKEEFAKIWQNWGEGPQPPSCPAYDNDLVHCITCQISLVYIPDDLYDPTSRGPSL